MGRLQVLEQAGAASMRGTLRARGREKRREKK
jgi:hypothetical protein